MGKTIISFNNVVKRFDDDETVLKKVSFDIEEGRFYTLLGPSGCGKTTILRIIAGFSDATEGDVYFDGQRINDVPANQRQVNTVFQDYALFPHMNVFENVAFGLRIKKLPKDEVNKKVLEALRLVQLPGYENREISEMSGGQRQRVAIARAIVNEPKVLLLDEPLSALDLKLRTDMQYELRELQQRLGITFIFVTHDQEEALAMSDEIFVMNKGKIVQSGTPVDIYDEPINHFVADFVGESNIVTGTMIEDNLVEFVGKQFECVDGGMRPNEAVEIVIRPEDLNLTTAEKGKLVVEVDTQLFRGVHYEIICYDEQGNEWMVHSTRKATEGSKMGLSFEPEDIHVMRFNESDAIPYVFWLLLFVIAPVLLIIYQSFFDMNGNFSLVNYQSYLGSGKYLIMTLNSVWYAFLITLITLVISYPTAYFLTKLRHKDLWLLLIILPTWVNLLLKAYAFIGIFGIHGSVNNFLEIMGVGPKQILFTDFSFLTVAVYIELPFMIMPIFNALEEMNPSLISASRDLGANSYDTFRRVIFPLSLNGVKSGVQAVFIPSLSLFMLTRLIGGNRVITLGTAIEQHFLVTQNWGMGSTIGVILIIAMFLVMLFTGEKKKGGQRK